MVFWHIPDWYGRVVAGAKALKSMPSEIIPPSRIIKLTASLKQCIVEHKAKTSKIF